MTSGLSQPTTPGSASRGFAYKAVFVQSIDGNSAVVTDTLTKTFTISMRKMPAKGIPPKVGEQWLVTRQYGMWTFALCLSAPTSIQESDIDGLVEDLAALNTRAHLLSILLGGAHVGYTTPANPATATTSATYVTAKDASNNVLGIAFLVPPSGITTVEYGMGINGGGGTTTASIAVSTGNVLGAGTPFLAANDNNAFATNASTTSPGNRTVPVTGLVAGNIYNAFIQWKNPTNSMAGAHPWLKTTPELA